MHEETVINIIPSPLERVRERFVMLKVGDRVRFLNATGGGVVRRFQNKDIVLVEEEDGFETPVLVRECVIVESINMSTNFPEKQHQAVMPLPTPVIIQQEPEKEEPFEYEETSEGEEMNVLLAFLAQDIKQLQNTNYEVYLVNDSNYFLYFVVSTFVKSSQKLQAQGKIEPNTRLLLTELNKNELNNWEKITVQCLPFKVKDFTKKAAVDVQLEVNLLKFYKLHSFIENDYFDEQAFLLPIVQKDVSVRDFSINKDQLKEFEIKNKERNHRPRIEQKPQQLSPILEVDLHINALLDTTSGMSNTDILIYQLDKFNTVLAENKHRKGQKIVFIHGKGEGVLRSEIMKQLKHQYRDYYVQDASFREYGFGATMVTIK